MLHRINVDLLALAGTEIPFFVTDDARLCFNPKVGDFEKSVFLITIPKSGTYFFAEVLKQLGFIYCGCHLSDCDVFDQRFGKLEDYRTHPDQYRKPLSFGTAASLILPSQFSVGHISYTVDNLHYLRDFYKVFVIREMRDVIVSCSRYYDKIQDIRAEESAMEQFKTKIGSERVIAWLDIWGKEYADLCLNMTKWREKDILKIKFEDFSGKRGNGVKVLAVMNLAKELGIELSCELASELMEKATNTTTVTSSGGLSNFRDYWDNNCERKFVELGFDKINAILGY